MPDFRIDLDAYLAKIGFNGPRKPTLEALQQIILSHQLSIPFENLNSFSGIEVSIDPAEIEVKLLHRGRGGYCHEQNQYLYLALQALGFDVRLKMARVRWMQQPDAMPQRGHMTLNVAVDGKWHLCDVAFGALTPTAPLLISTEEEQRTLHQTYRLIEREGDKHLEVRIGEFWRPVYSFDDARFYPVDFQAANWLVSTLPTSEFVTNLILARPDRNRRQILNNADLTFRYNDGRVEKTALESVEQLRSTIATMFGIRIPADARIDRALNRIFERVPQPA
jgi:N-hydroxyarylamine O-acetyltransferase